MSLPKSSSVSEPSSENGNRFKFRESMDVIQKRARLQSFISQPEKGIDDLFAEVTNHGQEMHKDWVDRLTKRVHSIFSEAEVRDLYKIPALNIMTLKEMQAMDGKVVRFRGMVQELYDPVLTQTLTTIKDLAAGVSREKCLLFTDKLHLDNNQIQVDVPENLGLHEMDLVHFISVPGENKWIMQVDEAYNEKVVNPENPIVPTDLETAESSATTVDPKPFPKAMLGFPLKSMAEDPSCKAVIGKIYRDSDCDIVMNDVLDVYGILMVDKDEQMINADADSENNDNDNGDPNIIRNPPCGIPRMTVLGYSKECSFELPRISLTVQQFDQLCALDDWRQPTRRDLKDLLVQCFSGDTLAARYVLMNLLSSVNSHVGGSPIGTFPVCITGIPLDLARLLNTVIQHITPKSVYLENFLDQIQNDCYVPWKDYDCDKLMGGILQLSKGTHLILEEREISEQQHRNLLNNQKAMQNLTALQKLIEWQTVGYDFKYQQMEFHHDIPILILSTSKKSLFSNVVQVPFQPVESLEFYETHLKPRILEILATTNDSKMSLLRDFISHTKKTTDFNIPPAIQEIIGNDFSEQRKAGEMDVDSLSSCLTHTRYWLNYEGFPNLTEEIWSDVLKAEKARKLRVINARNSQ